MYIPGTLEADPAVLVWSEKALFWVVFPYENRGHQRVPGIYTYVYRCTYVFFIVCIFACAHISMFMYTYMDPSIFEPLHIWCR